MLLLGLFRELLFFYSTVLKYLQERGAAMMCVGKQPQDTYYIDITIAVSISPHLEFLKGIFYLSPKPTPRPNIRPA